MQTITEQLKLPPPKNGKPAEYDDGDLQVAKAQASGLDTGWALCRSAKQSPGSGPPRVQEPHRAQAELNAHEATMREYDKQVHEGGQVAAVSVRRYGTMAGRIGAWFRTAEVLATIFSSRHSAGRAPMLRDLTAQHSALEVKADAVSVHTDDTDEKLEGLKNRSAERQILSILRRPHPDGAAARDRLRQMGRAGAVAASDCAAPDPSVARVIVSSGSAWCFAMPWCGG